MDSSKTPLVMCSSPSHLVKGMLPFLPLVNLLTYPFRTASVLIIELFTDESEVRVRQLSEIPGVSHVRLLQRPYIGFSALNGDDTYPSIMNWETGCVRKFTPPGSVHDLPVAREWTWYFRHVRFIHMLRFWN